MIESTLTRRSVIGHAVAGAGLITSLGAAHAQAAPKTFVLVHGGWHGGWCWRRVTDQLEAKGHKVYTPTFGVIADQLVEVALTGGQARLVPHRAGTR